MVEHYVTVLGAHIFCGQIDFESEPPFSIDDWRQAEELRTSLALPLPPDLFPVIKEMAYKRSEDFCAIVGGAEARTKLVATTLLRVATYIDPITPGTYMKTAIEIAQDHLAGRSQKSGAKARATDGAMSSRTSANVRRIMWAASAVVCGDSFAGIRDLYGLTASGEGPKADEAIDQILNQTLEEHLDALL